MRGGQVEAGIVFVSVFTAFSLFLKVCRFKGHFPPETSLFHSSLRGKDTQIRNGWVNSTVLANFKVIAYNYVGCALHHVRERQSHRSGYGCIPWSCTVYHPHNLQRSLSCPSRTASSDGALELEWFHSSCDQWRKWDLYCVLFYLAFHWLMRENHFRGMYLYVYMYTYTHTHFRVCENPI